MLFRSGECRSKREVSNRVRVRGRVSDGDRVLGRGRVRVGGRVSDGDRVLGRGRVRVGGRVSVSGRGRIIWRGKVREIAEDGEMIRLRRS